MKSEVILEVLGKLLVVGRPTADVLVVLAVILLLPVEPAA